MAMASKKKNPADLKLVREWQLPPTATLGSSVRAKGIMLEVRARLPSAVRRSLDVLATTLVLRMAEDRLAEFTAASDKVTRALVGIEDLPILPREIEDILGIKTSERHRWLKDGHLQSAGTKTVKLRGRARKITFHIFDPRHVEDLLEGDRIDAWREEHAATVAENRRRAAWKAKLAKAEKTSGTTPNEESERPNLVGFAEFERDFLR
jgi:hypothetical protein